MKSLFLFAVACMMLTAMTSCNRMPKCETPTFDEPVYDELSMGSQTYDATIYYTYRDDGETPPDPHSGSNVYRKPLYLESMGLKSPVVMKARAVRKGYRNSDIATETIIFQERPEPTEEEIREAIDAVTEKW